jgi:hypothetical protein
MYTPETLERLAAEFFEIRPGNKMISSMYSTRYNMCCPLCMEGKSWGAKTRFYLIDNEEGSYVACFNAGCKLNRRTDPLTALAMCTGKRPTDLAIQLFIEQTEYVKPETTERNNDIHLPDMSIKIDREHIKRAITSGLLDKEYARGVCAEAHRRKLDEAPFRSDLYMVAHDHAEERWSGRILIPFYDRRGRLVYYQGREALGRSDRLRYCGSAKSDSLTLFNVNILPPKPEYICITEGPIDAMFVSNCVAVATAYPGQNVLDYLTKTFRISRDRIIFIGDNPAYDETGRANIERAIDDGLRPFLWRGITQKDINQKVCETGDLYWFANKDNLLGWSECGVKARLLCSLSKNSISKEEQPSTTSKISSTAKLENFAKKMSFTSTRISTHGRSST